MTAAGAKRPYASRKPRRSKVQYWMSFGLQYCPSPITLHVRSNIRSTSISMLYASAISWNAASLNSSNSAASQPASKRPPETIGPSLLSPPSSYGSAKCPHHLGDDEVVAMVICAMQRSKFGNTRRPKSYLGIDSDMRGRRPDTVSYNRPVDVALYNRQGHT
jgi:hypothetical protein